MRYFFALLLCSVISNSGLAQDSKADLFGGYSYLNIDTNGLSSRQNANGWEASISGNFTKLFAAEADVSGYYKHYNFTGVSVSVSDYSYLAGPRLNFKPVFIHALIGGDHLSGGALGYSASQDGMAAAFGSGVQWRLSSRISFRTSADYVLTRHNILGGAPVTQNNVRASVGLVYSFGAPRPVKSQSEPKNNGEPGITVPFLSATVVPHSGQGAEIASELAGGIAVQGGLQVGDVINSVNDKPVLGPTELASELSALRPGDKIRIGVLIRGQWQSEKTIILGNK